MINYNDQIALLELISKTIRQDVTIYAFGGTAMMFYGYKDETKDIDLLFKDEEERNEFIRALKLLGYSKYSPNLIYLPEKMREEKKLLVYKREESRFDLFLNKVFQTLLSPQMKEEIYAVHEFRGKANLTVKVLGKEFLVMLKAVTEREKDYEDILNILKKEKIFNWQKLIDEVIWQYQHGDGWVLLDIEKRLLDLKKEVFIEDKYIQQLYNTVKKKGKD